MKKFILAVLLTFIAFPPTVLATIGVGVGTGKIQVTEKLYPGTIYTLPSLTVINTGDEKAVYGAGISYLENQPEARPDASWFTFTPSQFELEPGKAQVVGIKLNLPLKVVPGKYFAYVEGFPVRKEGTSGTSVGIAAAAKLYFTVSPASVLSAVYYRTLSIWDLYSPWPQRILVILGIIAVVLVGRKYFRVQIGVKKHEPKEEDKENG